MLDDDESWEQLATQPVGRIVTSVGDQVDIVPINFVVDGRSIVFRTGAGTKLVEMTINHRVLFEVDSFDDASGWSVVVRGEARVIDAEAELDRVASLGLAPFVPTLKPTWVRIEAASISGRAFTFGEQPEEADQAESY